jgi:SAM-dependent methyltransferase
MSNETSKAMKRRWKEDDDTGQPFWGNMFKGGIGIDVGCGPDKLPFENCIGFDVQDGDANDLSKYFPDNHFDYIHASHVLEHMIDPRKAFESWIKVLKPWGNIIGEVPSWELYEGKRDRSIWNPDHRSTWSMWSLMGGRELPHYYAPLFFTSFDELNMHRLHLVDSNYDYTIGSSIDQTNTPGNEVECFIEFVLQKK